MKLPKLINNLFSSQLPQRVRPLVSMRKSFYAGAIDRLSAAFNGDSLSVNEALKRNLVKMRHRSREECENNDYAKKFISMAKNNIVGNKGVRLQARCKSNDGKPDRLDNEAIETAWKDFSNMKYCGVTKRLSLCDIQRLTVATTAMEGECLIRIVHRNVYKYGIALQLIEADRLDVDYNLEPKNGNRIVMSVELDEFDVPVAYYVLGSHPSETVYTFAGKSYIRIPAEDIIHLFLPERIAQARGIPWMHASLRRLNMIGGYEEAELVAARAGASKMGFYTTESGDQYEGDDQDDNGNLIQTAEPGAFEELPQGTKFEAYDPQHPTGAYNYFLRGVLRGAAAGLGVSYTGYTGDLEAVNYSSIRAGLIEERENWRVLQGWFIEHVLARVYEAWLGGALSRGLIVNKQGVKLPLSKKEKFLNVAWQARGWAWVDPLKDQQANDAAVAAGHKTNSAVVAATGEDLEETYETLAWEKELAESYGLDFTPKTGTTDDEEETQQNQNNKTQD